MDRKFIKEEVETKTGKPNGKKPYTRGKRPIKGKPVRENFKRGGDNDVSWYSRSQQLVLDAAQLSYASILGARLEKDDNDWNDGQTLAVPNVPGIMALRWRPSVGISRDKFSTLNTASTRLYSFIRHANSGSANYESSDLMLYILAMDSLYTLHAMGVRAYGISRFYTMKNRYVPDELLLACGFNPAVQNNLADFRMFLNVIALKLSSLAVPSEFDLFKRHVWMTSGVYADSPNEKAQLYVFRPEALWKYNPIKYETGGALEPISLVDIEGWSLQEYMDLVNNWISPILSDEDMNIMSGDILKAYGNEGVVRVSTIPEDFFIIPEFNMEVLSQIQNATILQVSEVTTNHNDGEIWQDGNKLYFDPAFTTFSGKGNRTYKMITMSMENPQPADTMVATRLSTMLTEQPIEGYLRLDSVGSEYITHAEIHTRAYQKVGGNYVYKSRVLNIWRTQYPLNIPSTADAVINEGFVVATNNELLNLLQISKFQMHPTLEIYTSKFAATAGPGLFFFRDYLGDLDTYTQVTRSTLRKMHDTAVLSMLHVEGAYRR